MITMTPGLISVAFRSLAYKRFRSVLTVIAVMLGTAVVAATLTTNAAVEDSLRRAALNLVGNADLVVEALDDQGFPSRAVDSVRDLPEVTLVAPQVQRRTFFRTRDRQGFI